MKKENLHNNDDTNEIKILDLLNIISAKIYPISFLTIFAILSLMVYLSFVDNLYTSTSTNMVQASNEENINFFNNPGNILSSSFGIGSNDSSKSDYLIEKMKSREFITNFVTDNNYFLEVNASDEYVTKDKNITYYSKDYDFNTKEWLISNEKLFDNTYGKVLKMLSIDDKSKPGFITISVTHKSPVFAKNFLNNFLSYINQVEKKYDLYQKNRSLQELQYQYDNSKKTIVKNSLSKLIEKTLYEKVIIETSNEYALKVIDPPVKPLEKSYPKKLSILIAFSLIFFTLNCLIFIAYDNVVKRRL